MANTKTGYVIRNSDKTFYHHIKTKRKDIELLSEYKGSTQPIKARSLICGHAFETLAYRLSGTKMFVHGCPKCGAKTRAAKGSAVEFKKLMKETHPHLKVIGEYVNRTTKIDMHCKLCKIDFKGLPHRLLTAKYGCVECSRSQTGYKRTEYKIKGKRLTLQGYEHHFAKTLAKKRPELFKELQSGRNVPTFNYEDVSPSTGKMTKRSYRPDFYIPSIKTIVEVKSTQTAAGKEEWFVNLLRKRAAVKAAGYAFCLYVFNSKGEVIRLPAGWQKLKAKQIAKLR